MSYGLFGLVGHERLELLVHPVDGIAGPGDGRVLEVVRRQEAQELPDALQARLLALGGEVGDARDAPWVSAPPSSSKVTSSWVTALMTSGPVTNM